MAVTRERFGEFLSQVQKKQVNYIIGKMAAGKTVTALEHKTVNKYVDQEEERLADSNGRFMTANDVAKHYGVKPATVWQHVRKKNFAPNKDGTFNKRDTDAYWCEKLGKQKIGMSGKPVDDAGDNGKAEESGVSALIDIERLRKLKAEADAKEYIAKQIAGGVADWSDVKQKWAERARLNRDLLVALIDRLPPMLVGLEQKEIRSILEQEVRAVLKAHQKYGKFTPRARL